jgi:hypothetical protein
MLGRSNDNAYEEGVNKSDTKDLAMDNDVNNGDHGNEERTNNNDNSKIVVKNRKKDFEFIIAVGKSNTRRHWLQCFVWLHRYKMYIATLTMGFMKHAIRRCNECGQTVSNAIPWVMTRLLMTMAQYGFKRGKRQYSFHAPL